MVNLFIEESIASVNSTLLDIKELDSVLEETTGKENTYPEKVSFMIAFVIKLREVKQLTVCGKRND